MMDEHPPERLDARSTTTDPERPALPSPLALILLMKRPTGSQREEINTFLESAAPLSRIDA